MEPPEQIDVFEGQDVRLVEADSALREDSQHAIGVEDPSHGPDRGGQRGPLRVIRNDPANKAHDAVFEASAEVGLARAEPGDARLERQGGHHDERIEPVVVIADELVGSCWAPIRSCERTSKSARRSARFTHHAIRYRSVTATLSSRGPTGRHAAGSSRSERRGRRGIDLLPASRIHPRQGERRHRNERGCHRHGCARADPSPNAAAVRSCTGPATMMNTGPAIAVPAFRMPM